MLPRRSQYKMPLPAPPPQQQQRNLHLPLHHRQQQPQQVHPPQFPRPPKEQYSYWSPPPLPAQIIPLPQVPAQHATSPLYESPVASFGASTDSKATPRKWVGIGAHHGKFRRDQVMVEHPQLQTHPRQQQQPGPRPRMGLGRAAAPVMTSTPLLPQLPQQEKQPKAAPIAEEENEEKYEEEEEPIYCEITRGDASPMREGNIDRGTNNNNNINNNSNPPVIKPALAPPQFASVQRRGNPLGGSGRKRVDRQARRQAGLAGDFSQMRIQEEEEGTKQQQPSSKKEMLLQKRTSNNGKNNKKAESRRSCDLSNGNLAVLPGGLNNLNSLQYRPPGLGRRAATQVDMVVGPPGARSAHLRHQQRLQHQQNLLLRGRRHQASSSRNLAQVGGCSDTESVQSHPMGLKAGGGGRPRLVS